MNSDEEQRVAHSNSKQYASLRSDLSAALAAFDRAQDWADLIHDLQRVNRILNKHPPSTVIPEKHLLAKRLAQCLTSFLPSGVHLKALETYHLIFTRIGPARLARDLPLYAGGLFPLLSYCSTSLKAPLLALYETHLLPLGLALCPILDGFVLAILPGLEDESSEFYGRSRKLLDSAAKAVQDVPTFARALWRGLLLSPPMRLAAAHYLRSFLSSRHDPIRTEMVSDMPLVAYAITSALSDENTLTQRSVLDLLLGELALDSTFFRCESPEHSDAAVAVVGGVFGSVLRRDMSLTKRVHAWLLGGLHLREAIEFCNEHSKGLVLAAIDAEIKQCLKHKHKTSKTATKPMRIADALMNREELRECLGHHFALRILRYGMLAVASNNSEHERDLRAAIADLVQDIGSARVFAELERTLSNDDDKNHTDFELLIFALSMFPTKNDVIRKKHLPELLRVAVHSLNAVSTDSLTLDKAVAFCSRAAMAMGLCNGFEPNDDLAEKIKRTVASFASFFVAWLAHVIEPAPVELRRAYADVTDAEEHAAELRMSGVYETRKECISLAKGACSFFVTVASSGIGGTEVIRSSLQATAKCASAADVRISLAGSTGFAAVSANAFSEAFSDSDYDEQALGVIRRCWRQMHPSLRTATAQSAQAFLRLQDRFPVESKVVVADGILSKDLPRRLRNLERFACLWRLAVEHRLRPLPADNHLFLMLDALTDEDWGPKMLARSWLSDSLEVDAASIVDAPLRLLLTEESRTTGPGHEFSAVYDAPRALYGFQVLRAILESCPTAMRSSAENNYALSSPRKATGKDGKRGRTGVRALAAIAPTARTAQMLATSFRVRSDDCGLAEETEGPVALNKLLPSPNYVITIALTCLGYLRGRIPDRFSRKMKAFGANRTEKEKNSESPLQSETDSDADLEWILAGLGPRSMAEQHKGVCAAAAECLAALLGSVPVPSQMSVFVSNSLAKSILSLIRGKAKALDPVVELHFLNAMTFLVTADGPCYLSTVQGKDTFAKSDTGRIRISFSESQLHLQSRKPTDKGAPGVYSGTIESLDSFVPWLLHGVAGMCGSSREHDTGSQEVLGVRRKWILFMETVIGHIGTALPEVTEGFLLILSLMLDVHSAKSAEENFGDSEFSRVDETLVLLEGLAVVASSILWSFEHALANGDLKDDIEVTESSTKSDLATVNGTSLAQHASASGLSRQATSASKSGTAAEDDDEAGNLAGRERVNSATNATAAMMNAINPLRMINDFVKDVLSGSGSDGICKLSDPRRSGARVLFNLLPGIFGNIAWVWGPVAEPSPTGNGILRERVSHDSHGPPRLSTELPRERRQSQRAAALSVIEPLFQLRPTDVVASVITLFCREQDSYGSMPDTSVNGVPSHMASHILHALDYATPDVVMSCVKIIFEKAVKWDRTCVEAGEGRAQMTFRQRAKGSVQKLISPDSSEENNQELGGLGQMKHAGTSSPLAGGTDGLDLAQPLFPTANRIATTHQDLFHWGDFFAEFSAVVVETGCLNFLEYFILTCSDGDDLHTAWPILHTLLKDSLSTARRKCTLPATLRVLGTFVSKHPVPFPERKHRREIVVTAVMAISMCASIAAGSTDVSSEEQKAFPEFKKELSIVALQSLASAVPKLVDSCFLEDKPQLSASVTATLAPAVSTLKKAAARAASIRTATESSRRLRGSIPDATLKQKTETVLDARASKAAANVLLQISSRDWGVKHTRREIVSLLDDSNFFYAKEDGVLEQISRIVREVVASGSAPYLLSSIGAGTANGTPGIPSIFTGRDTEAVIRARTIRRIAFCIFVSEPDFYSPQLPSILEKIRDALRLADSTLITECLLCLRVLLLRTGPGSISAFRATTLSEMFRIACHPREDLNATVGALKFLDLITLLAPPDFGFERCFFFGDREEVNVEVGDRLKPFTPLASKLAELWTSGKKEEEIFRPPLRLEKGRTVLPGNAPRGFDEEFIGRYAAGLSARNSIAKMTAGGVDRETICQELELEFLM